ncbi:hypothetical protein HPB47_019456 [Ixodes persulcatus]|uniref:Uncharacterized protein n=1 Tax=Ixodes persulcatus TaxID=34615 RepID=A0AC60QID4_IXOPE|nr:hypothetical protein HPB47_019456 [Ixodes persulcatus]
MSAICVCSFAKVILSMETGTIPGNLHFKEPNPGIPSLNDGSIRVVDRHTPFPGGLVGVNSIGLGGANVHAILEANPGPHVDSFPLEKPQLPRLVLLAGRTQESLTKGRSVNLPGSFWNQYLDDLTEETENQPLGGHDWRNRQARPNRGPALAEYRRGGEDAFRQRERAGPTTEAEQTMRLWP